MPAAKRKKSSQTPSQGSDNLHHTTVATPEIQVSLVDRMKKRFSTRHQASSDPSSELEITGASQADKNPITDTGARKKPTKRKSLGQKVQRIDKFFSPDTSKVFRSPTRFPSKSEKLALAAADSESDDGRDETQSGPKQAETRSSSNRDSDHSDNDGQGKSSRSSAEKSMDESVNSREATRERQEDSQGEGASLQKGSDSDDINQRGSLRGAAGAEESDRAGSGEDPGGSSQQTPTGMNRDKGSPKGNTRQDSGRSTRKSTRTKGKGNAVMASGEVESHMADREFISNQVRVMSAPFVLESGPRSWMQVWKAQQSSHDVDPPDIPSSVIDRIVTKINFHMEDVYGRLLGRQQQRNTLMGLDELRKAAQDECHSNLPGDIVPSQASLEEIISCYPSVWAESINDQEAETAERYSSLWARLFALNQSLSVNKKQCEQYKLVADTLQRIDTNLDKCSPEEFEKEVQRTGELVSQIKQKLEGGVMEEAPPEGERSISDSDNTSPSPLSTGNHTALVKLLFKAAASTEST